jgi:hypothetical protein
MILVVKLKPTSGIQLTRGIDGSATLVNLPRQALVLFLLFLDLALTVSKLSIESSAVSWVHEMTDISRIRDPHRNNCLRCFLMFVFMMVVLELEFKIAWQNNRYKYLYQIISWGKGV